MAVIYCGKLGYRVTVGRMILQLPGNVLHLLHRHTPTGAANDHHQANHLRMGSDREWQDHLHLPHPRASDEGGGPVRALFAGLAALWCEWMHGGGWVLRDPAGRVNWQCRKCGRWAEPVSESDEANLLKRHMERREADYFAQMDAEEAPDDEAKCPECDGDGGDKWNDYSLPCPTCGGDGRLW